MIENKVTEITSAPVLPTIVSCTDKKTFSLAEATNLLPLIYRITEDASKLVRSRVNRIEALKGSNPMLASDIETEINSIANNWQKKMTRLGVHPKGLWLADFDNGQGYYCWKFPETEIRFWHGYQDGFSGRIEIQ